MSHAKKNKNVLHHNHLIRLMAQESSECKRAQIPHAQDNNLIVMPTVTLLLLDWLVLCNQTFRLMSCTANIRISRK